jgi:tRNA (mo5U34)-methyltransferase
MGGPDMAWFGPLLDLSEKALRSGQHGDLPRWHAALAALPAARPSLDLDQATPVLGVPAADPDALSALLMALHPWRKGPFRLGGVLIDTEWRSDWKWARIAPQLELAGHRVLDVGCGNGYFGWRMLGAGARSVIGIDPTLLYVMQWLACRHFAGEAPNFVLPLKLEQLPESAGGFDSVFSLGVLYHRRDPLRHLRRLAALVRAGGQVVLESLVVEGAEARVLEPGGRYARMPNVHAIPSVPRLLEWVAEAGLGDVRVLDVTRTSTEEQRSTPWMRFESLAESLDPTDAARTIEGHPAPLRAALVARAP